MADTYTPNDVEAMRVTNDKADLFALIEWLWGLEDYLFEIDITKKDGEHSVSVQINGHEKAYGDPEIDTRWIVKGERGLEVVTEEDFKKRFRKGVKR